MAKKEVYREKQEREERGVTMTTRDAFLKKAEAQLKEWRDEVENLKAEAIKIKPDTRMIYYNQLQALSVKQETAGQKLAELRLAGKESWEEMKVEVENALTAAKEDIDRLKEIAHYGGLSWARGIAKEHVIRSIGWAEGIAKEDPLESIGWAEGIAKENLLESIGWAEGYHREEEKS